MVTALAADASHSTGDLRTGGTPPLSDAAVRVVDAMLRCIARWGVAKTTLDDVAREAGCSRATVYRLFPGGKDGLLSAVAGVETERFFAGVCARAAEGDSLEDTLVLGITEAGRRLAGHDALGFVVAYELEAILPFMTFQHKERVLAVARLRAEPVLRRWLGASAPRAAEWVARVVLSYAACPAGEVDLAEERSVRRLVGTFLLPGLHVLATGAPCADPSSAVLRSSLL